MAHEATTWAYSLPIQNIAQKFVLVALADMADQAYSCFPGQDKLAEMTGASLRTVQRALSDLEAAGLIEREERRRAGGYRSSDRYYLKVGSSLPSHPSESQVTDGQVTECQVTMRQFSPDTLSNLTRHSDGYIEEELPEELPEESPASLSPDESDDHGTLIPADWRPNQTHIDKAASLHLDVVREYHRFRQRSEETHRRLKGVKGWNAGFTNWLRKAAEFNQQRGPRPALNRAQQRQADNLAVVAQLGQIGQLAQQELES
jgi:hypothetical protein